MSSPIVVKRKFPWTDSVDGLNVTFRLMAAQDRAGFHQMALKLTEEDLAFLRTDITDDTTMDEYLQNIERGRTVTVLLDVGGQIIGYGSLHHDEQLWTHHMGEIRILVLREYRGKGLGKKLVSELFHIADSMGLQRVVCQIPAEQGGVRAMLEELGFQPEALLREWLLTRDGSRFDLLVMTKAVDTMGY